MILPDSNPAIVEDMAELIRKHKLRGNFFCLSGCTTTNPVSHEVRPKSWQTEGEWQKHQKDYGHRIMASPQYVGTTKEVPRNE